MLKGAKEVASQLGVVGLSNILVSLNSRVFAQTIAAKCGSIAIRVAYDQREILCHVMAGSGGGFALWKRGIARRTRLGGAQLRVPSGSIRRSVKRAFGSLDLFGELEDVRHSLSRAQIEHVMEGNSAGGRHKRRYQASTNAKNTFTVEQSLLDLQFQPSRPGMVCSACMFTVAGEHGLHHAQAAFLFDPSVVGLAMRRGRTKTHSIGDDVSKQWFRRRPLSGVVHRADRNSHDQGHELQAWLNQIGMTCSINCKANCRDKAPTKIFLSSLKNERIHGTRYETCEPGQADSFEYIALF